MDIMSNLAAFGQVILLDIVLSGDNAVIVGTLAASLPPAQRNKALFFGMSLAVVFRVVFTLGMAYLLRVPFIQIIGGLLLLWVAWKMYSDLRDNDHLDGSNEAKNYTSFGAALFAITMADISMSLDNVLAVAGAASHNITALIFGLGLSILLMMFAAKLVASLIDRYKWIAWVGLALILFVAGKMFVEGYHQAIPYFA